MADESAPAPSPLEAALASITDPEQRAAIEAQLRAYETQFISHEAKIAELSKHATTDEEIVKQLAAGLVEQFKDQVAPLGHADPDLVSPGAVSRAVPTLICPLPMRAGDEEPVCDAPASRGVQPGFCRAPGRRFGCWGRDGGFDARAGRSARGSRRCRGFDSRRGAPDQAGSRPRRCHLGGRPAPRLSASLRLDSHKPPNSSTTPLVV